jgi:hypothetical protein
MAPEHSGADAFGWRERLSISTFALIMAQCGENGRQSASSVSHTGKAVRRVDVLGKACSDITLGTKLGCSDFSSSGGVAGAFNTPPVACLGEVRHDGGFTSFSTLHQSN